MKDKKEFYSLLTELDGQPVSEYRQLVGDFDFARYVIKCNKLTLESDEGLAPVFTIRVPQTIAEIPDYLFDSPVRRTAMEDLLSPLAGGGRLARACGVSYLRAPALRDLSARARQATAAASPGAGRAFCHVVRHPRGSPRGVL